MGYSLDETHLRLADNNDVKGVLAHQAAIRSLHRADRKGRSQDGVWADLGAIPPSVYFSQWFQERFPPTMPMAERVKEMRKFYKENPKLMSRDRV